LSPCVAVGKISRSDLKGILILSSGKYIAYSLSVEHSVLAAVKTDKKAVLSQENRAMLQ